MVFLIIETTIQADKMLEFEQAIDYIMQTDKINQGCLKRGMYHEYQGANHLLYLEEWKTGEELQKHISSDLFKSLLGAMKVLGEVTTAQIISSRTVYPLEKYLD